VAEPRLPREELEAALEARRELGREREPEVVDSFLTRIEREIDARVDARLARRRGRPGTDWGFVLLAIASLGIGIGVTGTALGTDHAWVAAVAWLAIVLVNALYLRRPP
jgi:hypothetical protein